MGRRPDQRLQIVSAADQVYDVLRERILRGELEGGSRVHQQNVSGELGVSRSPVREALARMAADGLVELLPNRGARVVDVTLDDIRTAYEARLAVEPLAARLAAQRRTDDDLKQMARAIVEQRRAGNPRTVYQCVRRFHVAVVDAAANPLLSRFASSLWAGRIGLHVLVRQVGHEALAADAEDHDAIVAAIRDGDGALAERALHDHIAGSLDRFLDAAGESTT
jgi:DNA-binding GntR family transcriptional regulator